MKLKGILLTSALAAMLGVGVFAGVSGNKNVSKAEAGNSYGTNWYVTGTVNSKNWGNWQKIATLNSDLNRYELNVSVTTSSEFKIFNAASYDGHQINRASSNLDYNGKGWLAYTDWAEGDNFKMKEAGNFIIYFDAGIAGYNNVDWAFGIEKNVPKYTVNFYMDDKTTLYDSVQVPEGESASCSKADPTKAQVGGLQYTFAGWKNNDGTAADLTNITGNKNVYASFSSSYAAGRYLIGNFGTCSWDVKDIGSAIYVPSTGSQYEVTNVSFSRNDTLKCVYYNGSGYESYYGWSSTRTQCGAYYCFSNDKDDNLVVVASGRYNFYFTDGDFGDGKKISIEINGSSRNAEQLAAKLMSFGPANPGVAGDNSCGNENKFPAMKSMYLNNLSESEQSTFRGYASSNVDQFKNAYDRYIAWAAALGEKPWEEGKISGAAPLANISNDSSTTVTTTATVVTSIIAISTAAGFIFLKKKAK